MKNVLRAGFLVLALVMAVTAIGCAASGGYSGSDGHYGHSH